LFAVIICESLNVNNGAISYSQSAPYEYGSQATYSCRAGFFLEGNSDRICDGDGLTTAGSWDGGDPVCSGE